MTNLVESAMRAKAPIVAIPQPGERPFCVRRELLVKSLKGLRIIEAGIQLPLDSSGSRQLVVFASAPHVKAVRKFAPIKNYHATWSSLSDWAARQRVKRSAPQLKLSACGKQIARLEKQLAKLGPNKPPVHPLLEHGTQEIEWMRERDAREHVAWESITHEGCAMDKPNTLAQSYAQWKREAPIRRWIQQQVRIAQAKGDNSTKIYRTLESRGIHARKWSDLHTYDRERCKDLWGYFAHLWEFCGLEVKEHAIWHYYFQSEPAPECGPEHYHYWIEKLHERQALESQIESLRQLEVA